jgi:N-acetylmuramoyl-L-alanine amidase
MTIPVEKMLVPEKKFPVKCPHALDAEYITIHNTANDASAENEVQYMIANSKEVSFHYAVDEKEVIQGISNTRNAWHAGDGANGKGNRKSLSVEICYSKSGGDRYKKAEALSIKFVAQLLHERKWGINRVKKHEDWSGKHCPHRILDEGRWQEVLSAIDVELKRLNDPTPQYASDAHKVTVDGKYIKTIEADSALLVEIKKHLGHAKEIKLERV